MNHQSAQSSCSGCTASNHSASCRGCFGGGELILCQEEVQILWKLGQFAFLPIVQKSVNGEVAYEPIPDEQEGLPENFSQLVSCLEQKRLITIDPDIPLSNVDYGPRESSSQVRCGSIAMTVQGQEVLDWLTPPADSNY